MFWGSNELDEMVMVWHKKLETNNLVLLLLYDGDQDHSSGCGAEYKKV